MSDALKTLAEQTHNQWVSVIGVGSWATCFGPFESYDEAMSWVRSNQFEEAAIYPVNSVETVGTRHDEEKHP